VGRYVVKLGSNIVAHDDGSLRNEVLEHICAEVAERHQAGDDIVIVTSGAIARGVGVMELKRRPATMADLQAASAVGQGKLYRVYDELLRERGVMSAQVLLTFFDVGHRGHYLNARRTLGRLLDWRVVPVINENDTTATEEISFGDNDFLAAQVAILVGADRLVLLTNQDGLHTADPRSDPGSELVREVNDVRELAGYSIGHVPSELGSGGMRSKVVAAEMATAAGIPATICSGLRDGVLARALAGEAEGTRFAAQEQRHSSFELWLKYAKPAAGSVVVDAGAARALRDGGASLLPVGVVEVEGAFGEGDAIEIRDSAGPLAKGISSYAAADVRKAMGRKTPAVRELLPRAADEVVHRDYLVLL
jgi:glutamate 5-kinase